MWLRFKLSAACLLGLLFFEVTQANAQNDAAQKKDFVLVATFPQPMYYCSGEHHICKSSDINPGQLNEAVRRSIARTLVEGLSEHYNTKAVSDDSPMAGEYGDLGKLYSITTYHNKKKRLKAYYKGYPPFKLGKIIAPRHVRWGSDCISSTKTSKPNKRKRNYQQAAISNDSLYKEIMTRNSGVYLVYISNFELFTRYKSCLDPRENVFQRDLYIHYNLFDAEGEFMDGGVVGTTFQSSTNDIEVILERNLGILCGYIIDFVRNEI